MVNIDCVLLLKLTIKSHKLMVATDLLASYGCGIIMSSTEGCTNGSAYTMWFVHDVALRHVTCNLKHFVNS
jgi:hypothetical protein